MKSQLFNFNILNTCLSFIFNFRFYLIVIILLLLLDAFTLTIMLLLALSYVKLVLFICKSKKNHLEPLLYNL